jgi:hypothetical protein
MSWWQRHSPLISVAPGDALTATASLEAHGNLHDEYAARVVARRTGQKFNASLISAEDRFRSGSWPFNLISEGQLVSCGVRRHASYAYRCEQCG